MVQRRGADCNKTKKEAKKGWEEIQLEENRIAYKEKNTTAKKIVAIA